MHVWNLRVLVGVSHDTLSGTLIAAFCALNRRETLVAVTALS